MATSRCTAASRRRLSDLLQEEQQEPLLLLHLLLQADHDDGAGATPARTPAPAAATRSLLRGTTRLARRWADDVLAGCFPRAAAARHRLRRLLPRPGRDSASSCAHAQPADDGAVGGGCGRPPQLSPVSVLDLLSRDESSTVPGHPGDDDGKPSTPGNSPSRPSIHDDDDDHDLPGKTHAVEGERFQRKSAALFASAWERETVAVSLSLSLPLPLVADSSWTPSLQVERDLSGSPRRDCWRRLVVGGRAGEQEARQVARSVEAMIFEEVRWEAVLDMLSLPPQP